MDGRNTIKILRYYNKEWAIDKHGKRIIPDKAAPVLHQEATDLSKFLRAQQLASLRFPFSNKRHPPNTGRTSPSRMF